MADWWAGTVVPQAETGSNPFLVIRPKPFAPKGHNPFLDSSAQTHSRQPQAAANPQIPANPHNETKASIDPSSTTPATTTLLPGPPKRQASNPTLPPPPPRQSVSEHVSTPYGMTKIDAAPVSEDALKMAEVNWQLMIKNRHVANIPIPDWIVHHVKSASNILRVFFSSPFGGMEKEREILTKQYFPELRSLCERSGLTFVPIDLRWGITEQDAQDALVIFLCLYEIERSDLFIGFYAQRYGWHGSGDKLLMNNYEKAKDRFGWIEEYREQSVTELEFLAGHFNCPKLKQAAFYFRDASYDNEMRDKFEAIGDAASARKFKVESAAADIKRLKLIQMTKDDPTCLCRQNDYKTPEEGARLMYEDLKATMLPRLELAQLEKQTRSGDPEAAQHEIYLATNSKLYFGGVQHFEAINKYIESDVNCALLIQGEPGTGKTSLVANWVTNKKKAAHSHILITHFVGCSSRSTTLLSLLQRVVLQLSTITKNEINLADFDVAQLITKFESLLNEASQISKIPIIIVIDALDEMEDSNNAKELSWLPIHFPPRIRVVLSTTDPDIIKERELSRITITTLPREVLAQIIDNQLKNFAGKELSAVQKERILSSPACGNPLYLLVLVTELCQFGDFFQLNAKIEEYLAASNTKELFSLVLARLDVDTALPGEDSLFSKVMSTLVVSRNGLSDYELQAVLNITSSRWSRLWYSLENFLVVRSGQIFPRRLQLRQAVLERYLDTTTKLHQTIDSLIVYFNKNLNDSAEQATQRIASELPYLFQKKGDKLALRNCITDSRMFAALSIEMANGVFDLLDYWRFIGASPQEVSEAYMSSINQQLAACTGTQEEYNDIAKACQRVGHYLAEAGNLSESLQPFIKSIALYEAAFGPTDQHLSDVLSNAARACSGVGDMVQAAQFAGRALELAKLHFGEDDIRTANAMMGLAVVYKNVQQYDDAGELLTATLKIYQTKLRTDDADVAGPMNLLGEVLQAVGDSQQALSMFQRALVIRERGLGRNHPSTGTTCASLGNLYLELGDLEKAEQYHTRAYQVRASTFGPEHPETVESMIPLAQITRAKGDVKGAYDLLNKALAIMESQYGKLHICVCDIVDRLADWKHEDGDVREAVVFYKRALQIKEQAFGPTHHTLADIYYNLAGVSMQLGDKKEALQYIQRTYDIALESYGPDHPLTVECAEKIKALKGR